MTLTWNLWSSPSSSGPLLSGARRPDWWSGDKDGRHGWALLCQSGDTGEDGGRGQGRWIHPLLCRGTFTQCDASMHTHCVISLIKYATKMQRFDRFWKLQNLEVFRLCNIWAHGQSAPLNMFFLSTDVPMMKSLFNEKHIHGTLSLTAGSKPAKLPRAGVRGGGHSLKRCCS